MSISVVYIVTEQGRRGQKQMVKIGVTTNIEKRLKALRAGTSATLRLVATGPGTRTGEAALHQHFRKARVHGEWFALTPGQLDAAAGYVRSGTHPPSWRAQRTVSMAAARSKATAKRRHAGLLPRDGGPAASRVRVCQQGINGPT